MRAAVAVSSLDAVHCSLDSAINVAFPAIPVPLGLPPGRIAPLNVFYHVPVEILTVLVGLLGDRFGRCTRALRSQRPCVTGAHPVEVNYGVVEV